MSALPFSAVVGQDDAKTALILAAIQPRLGGVLLRGQKGSAKTTLARGLARLLPGDAPFVELPLGATEDRVLGSLDLTELLTDGNVRYRPGLLAAADGGVLYVDEINLLADHLVDVLLDVAVTGVNRVEREGMSHQHAARFTLVASMNPEEGELRPQLLDRFGLAVDIETSTDVALRTAAVSAQLAADRDPASLAEFNDADRALRAQLQSVTVGEAPPAVVELASRVAVALGAEGLRADLMLCRAAGALAGWEQRLVATEADLRRVAPFVLAHRRRRTPFEDPGLSADEIDAVFAEPPTPDELGGAGGAGDESIPPAPRSEAPRLSSRPSSSVTSGRRDRSATTEGRHVRDVPADDDTRSVAAGPTAVALATRRALDPEAELARDDLRTAVRESRVGGLVILVVDTSGSMGADRRIASAKAVALELLAHAYQHRDRVALITFRGQRAEIVLRPTGSVEIARARLADLTVGGTTPLADALDTARGLAERERRDRQLEPLVVLMTDGRATVGGDDPVGAARAAASNLASARIATLVVDAETSTPRLGLAAELAVALCGECVPIDDFATRQVVEHLRRDR